MHRLALALALALSLHLQALRLPVYTARKKDAVSEDSTLEPSFKYLRFQGRQHAVVV